MGFDFLELYFTGIGTTLYDGYFAFFILPDLKEVFK